MRMGRILPGILASAFVAAFATTALAQGGMDAPSDAISKIRTTYVSALNNKDVETIANLYAADARFMGPDGVVHVGQEAIANTLQEQAPTWGHFVTYPGEIIVSENTAWEMGQGVQHITAEDGSMIDPVYLFSGEFYETAEDLGIPGRGFDLVWARKYRSRAGPVTEIGNGWDFSYNVYIEQSGPDLLLRLSSGEDLLLHSLLD